MMYRYYLYVGDDEAGVFSTAERAWAYASTLPQALDGMCVVESYEKPH